MPGSTSPTTGVSEETPVPQQEPVEEIPAEETPQEEIPTEETPVEESDTEGTI